MFAAAGLPEAREGRWSQAMIDATVIHGDESACAAKLDSFIETAGCEHLIVSVLATGSDQSLSIRRSLDLIGRYATAR
jgi:hypothetical protein